MLSRGLTGRGTGEMAAPAGAHGKTAGSPAIQEKELTLFAAHLPPAKQVSDPLLIGGVPLDAFLVFLFLGNLAYLLLRRALDGRVSHGTAAIVQYGVIIAGVYGGARYLFAFDLRAFVASPGIFIAVSSTRITQNCRHRHRCGLYSRSAAPF